MRRPHLLRRLVGVLLLATMGATTVSTTGGTASAGTDAVITPPPGNEAFDYQLAGDYDPAPGVTVVARDWFVGAPLTGAGTYSICYVNGFQTQADEPDADRPDETENWPPHLVLTGYEDDPNWDGEYLIDISTPRSRRQAARWLEQMIDTCATKGFDAVEFDNLDSWTRLPDLPFGRRDAVRYARRITAYAHGKGLAVGQKNTVELGRRTSREVIGFDFVVAEQCGQYDECRRYRRAFGDRVLAIEYRNDTFAAACAAIGEHSSVIRRDRNLTVAGSATFVYDEC